MRRRIPFSPPLSGHDPSTPFRQRVPTPGGIIQGTGGRILQSAGNKILLPPPPIRDGLKLPSGRPPDPSKSWDRIPGRIEPYPDEAPWIAGLPASPHKGGISWSSQPYDNCWLHGDDNAVYSKSGGCEPTPWSDKNQPFPRFPAKELSKNRRIYDSKQCFKITCKRIFHHAYDATDTFSAQVESFFTPSLTVRLFIAPGWKWIHGIPGYWSSPAKQQVKYVIWGFSYDNGTENDGHLNFKNFSPIIQFSPEALEYVSIKDFKWEFCHQPAIPPPSSPYDPQMYNPNQDTTSKTYDPPPKPPRINTPRIPDPTKPKAPTLVTRNPNPRSPNPNPRNPNPNPRDPNPNPRSPNPNPRNPNPNPRNPNPDPRNPNPNPRNPNPNPRNPNPRNPNPNPNPIPPRYPEPRLPNPNGGGTKIPNPTPIITPDPINDPPYSNPNKCDCSSMTKDKNPCDCFEWIPLETKIGSCIFNEELDQYEWIEKTQTFSIFSVNGKSDIDRVKAEMEYDLSQNKYLCLLLNNPSPSHDNTTSSKILLLVSYIANLLGIIGNSLKRWGIIIFSGWLNEEIDLSQDSISKMTSESILSVSQKENQDEILSSSPLIDDGDLE